MRRFALPPVLLALGAMAAAGIHGALLWIYYHPGPKGLAGDERQYLENAYRLLDGQAAQHGLWPPLYPHVLAPLLRIGGGDLWSIQLLQTIFLIVAAGLLWRLTARLGGGPLARWLAAGLVVTYPPLVAFSHYLWPEVLHLTFFLAAILLALEARGSALAAIGVGVLLGLAVSTKSLVLPFVPLVLATIAFENPLVVPHRRRRLDLAVLAAAVLLATLSPVLVGQKRNVAEPTLAASAWFNIWVGLRDTSRRSLQDSIVHREYQAYLQSAIDPAVRDQVLRENVVSHVRQEGPIGVLREQLGRQYFRLFDRVSYLVAQLPGGILGRQGQGYAGEPTLVSRALRLIAYGLYAAVLVGAVIGLTLRTGWQRPGRRLVLLFLLYNAGLFLVLHVKSRYRIQLMPYLFLFAGLGAERLWALWCRRGDDATTPNVARPAVWRWLVAAVGSVLLLVLAFGLGPLVPVSTQ